MRREKKIPLLRKEAKCLLIRRRQLMQYQPPQKLVGWLLVRQLEPLWQALLEHWSVL